MKIFPKKLEKLVNYYSKVKAKEQEADIELISEFEKLDAREIVHMIELIKKHGQPRHIEAAVYIEECYNNGKMHGEQIVMLRDLAEANRKFFIEEDTND